MLVLQILLALDQLFLCLKESESFGVYNEERFVGFYSGSDPDGQVTCGFRYFEHFFLGEVGVCLS